MAPIMKDEQVCGFGNVKDYPVLYIPDLNSAATHTITFFDYSVCAKECPENPESTVECYNDACKDF